MPRQKTRAPSRRASVLATSIVLVGSAHSGAHIAIALPVVGHVIGQLFARAPIFIASEPRRAWLV